MVAVVFQQYSLYRRMHLVESIQFYGSMALPEDLDFPVLFHL